MSSESYKDLILLLLKEREYQKDIEEIGVLIFSKHCMTIREIIQESEKETKLVQNALKILISEGLVIAKLISPSSKDKFQSYFLYEFCVSQCFMPLRYPRMLQHIEEVLPDIGKKIVFHLTIFHTMTAHTIVEKVQENNPISTEIICSGIIKLMALGYICQKQYKRAFLGGNDINNMEYCRENSFQKTEASNNPEERANCKLFSDKYLSTIESRKSVGERKGAKRANKTRKKLKSTERKQEETLLDSLMAEEFKEGENPVIKHPKDYSESQIPKYDEKNSLFYDLKTKEPSLLVLNLDKFLNIFRNEIIYDIFKSKFNLESAIIANGILHNNRTQIGKLAVVPQTSSVSISQIKKVFPDKFQMEQNLIQSHLDAMLTNDAEFVELTFHWPKGNNSEYAINLDKVMDYYQLKVIERVIEERHGKNYSRIYRILNKNGFLEFKTILELSLLPKERIHSILQELLKENIIQYQEIEGGTKIRLFGINSLGTKRIIINNMYKTMLNLKLILSHLEKKDVELSTNEYKNRIFKLRSLITEVDDTLMNLTEF